ncbi:protein of unknown function (plasmid) [Shinella sp. WSC3-e]|nr:protein of unknown function [Shinella sp. WSC3-e]
MSLFLRQDQKDVLAFSMNVRPAP